MGDSSNFSDYLVDISDIHLPIKLSELFNNYNENVLELGFGDG